MAGRGSYKGGERFNERARAAGYAARSVYKLEEIDRRFHILRPGQAVVDLGCYPGSWTKYCVERCGRGQVVGVDLLEPEVAGASYIVRSVFEVGADELRVALGRSPDVVLSDMAPATTGNRLHDHVVQLELARCALGLAVALLVPGGAFVVKVFDGEDAAAFVTEVRSQFERVKRVRPEATRRASREFFVVGQGRLA